MPVAPIRGGYGGFAGTRINPFWSRFPAKKLNHLPKLSAGHLTRRFAPGGAETFAEIGISSFCVPILGMNS
ncbi:hypothetical protein B4135_4162 [Caldibacillus debilis]|uniref:Uncharacterized protein n=1 Tax=Caldibacillus debilis TaxID=301148 RepID=A0A150L7N4_9BACI|nr:hypothetical protein B4135_4162 [Caldibacillus debilis]